MFYHIRRYHAVRAILAHIASLIGGQPCAHVEAYHDHAYIEYDLCMIHGAVPLPFD